MLLFILDCNYGVPILWWLSLIHVQPYCTLCYVVPTQVLAHFFC
uniref:Uncharacterized protein n=1 Tax=Arundo donax TaxID=35708 RepID=A0A0A8ZZZ9_ARUDO